MIIKSGDGYLIKIEKNTPQMTSDRLAASSFNSEEALELKRKLEKLGFSAEVLINKGSDERFAVQER